MKRSAHRSTLVQQKHLKKCVTQYSIGIRRHRRIYTKICSDPIAAAVNLSDLLEGCTSAVEAKKLGITSSVSSPLFISKIRS